MASNPELEALCMASPDDPQPWSVYADWLSEHGDPRGHEAALRIAGKNAKPTLEDGIACVGWRHGFSNHVIVQPNRLADFLESPTSRFVDHLVLAPDDLDANDWGPALDTLLAWPHVAQIKALAFDAAANDDEIWDCSTGDLSRVWELDQLDELRIVAHEATLGPIGAGAIKRFARISDQLTYKEADAIASGAWNQLESLELSFGPRADLLQQCRQLITRRFPKLHHLGIVGCDTNYHQLTFLLPSPVIAQIQSLDLSRGTMDDRAVRTFVDHAERVRHLEWIDVSENMLTADDLAQLRTIVKDTRSTEKQRKWRSGYENFRYANTGE
ncbi:MAG: TIGR02996 domain-containing protein [Kofleriaceae bacterium]